MCTYTCMHVEIHVTFKLNLSYFIFCVLYYYASMHIYANIILYPRKQGYLKDIYLVVDMILRLSPKLLASL